MWHLSVPKILHVYWGGGVLPYLRYLTVKSFIEHNPDWQVWLWEPVKPTKGITWTSWEQRYQCECDDYYDGLKKIVESYYFNFEDFGRFKAEVHRSDFLRLYLLYHIGGVWSDMDIIYFKSIDNLSVNKPENSEKETFVCIGSYGHSAGFLMGVPGSKFFENMLRLCDKEYSPSGYQSIGPTMYTKYNPKIESIPNAVNIDMDAVYAHNATEIHTLIDGSKAKFTEGSIGCHWYAGHPQWGDYLKKTNGGVIKLDNVISKLDEL